MTPGHPPESKAGATARAPQGSPNTPRESVPPAPAAPPELERVAALLGPGGVARLRGLSVLVVGLGGVGSWCAEALARTGVGSLTLVDPDNVEPTNMGRQLPALASTLGQPKALALAARLAQAAPLCRVRALPIRYCPRTAPLLPPGEFDFVVDAIDSPADKALLISSVLAPPAPASSAAPAPQPAAPSPAPAPGKPGRAPRLVSSMGAARRLDPTLVRLSPFPAVQGDPLARALRRELRRLAPGRPLPDFPCAHSLEPPRPGAAKGSLCHVTAAFGMALAWAVVRAAAPRP